MIKKEKKEGVFCPNISASCFSCEFVMNVFEKHGFTRMVIKLYEYNELIKKYKGFSKLEIDYDI